MVVPTIVTVAQALAHLRLPAFPAGSPPSGAELDLEAKLAAATAAVVRYIVRPATVATIEAWTVPDLTAPGSPSTAAPWDVCAAVLITLGDLYRDRGDEGSDAQKRERGELPPAAVALLYRYRDPAVA